MVRLAGVIQSVKALVLRQPFLGALEAPAKGTASPSKLAISGWVLSRRGKVVSVEALLGTASFGLVPYGFERVDVARVFPTLDDRCGYEGTIELEPDFAGPQTLTVRVRDQSGHLQDFRRHIVIQEAPAEEPPEATMQSAAPDLVPPVAESTAAAGPEAISPAVEISGSLDHIGLAAPEPRFLVVTDALPTPDLDSGSFRLFQMLNALIELGYLVTLLSHSDERDTRYTEPLSLLGVDLHFGQDAAIAHLIAKGHRYHYVLLSRPEIAALYLFPVRMAAINATVAYDMVDLHWLRWTRASRVFADEQLARQAEQSKLVERFNALGSDLVVAITEAERRLVLESDPLLRVEIIPNIHPLPALTRHDWRARRDVMFIGGFQHAPNEDAMCYFVREVWPIITQELPDLVFHIVGSRPSDQVRRLGSSSVRVVGYVADPTPYFESARAFVAPLRYGAGMKGKIGQSMSYGLPVVTTSIGAEGMLLKDGDTALIADRPEDFARALIQIYTDEQQWTEIAANSIAHIEQHFSPLEARRRLSAIFPLPATPRPDGAAAAGALS